MRIKYVKRPGNRPALGRTLADVAREHVGDWFTENVPDDLLSDLRFQDALILIDDGRIQAFIAFTGIDRAIQIMMFATRRAERGKGYGTLLYRRFEDFIARYGVSTIRVQTVPPEANPNYLSTVAFYEKQGFKIVKRYAELWEHGAIELEKML